MKKSRPVALLLCCLSLALLMWGQTIQYAYQTPLQVFTTVTTSGGFRISATSAAFHVLTWNNVGTVSTCQIQVDSSVDGISWGSGDVIASTLCTSSGSVTSTSHVVNFVRINITALSGAGATISARLTGYVTNPSGGGGGTTINPTNNVLPKRSNATTFVDSALTDNGTNITSTEPFVATQGTITTSNPVLNHTATWNAGGVAFTNWLSNITCTAAAANSRGMAVQVGGVDALVLNFTGTNCATATQLLVGKTGAGGVIGLVGGTSGTATITGPATATGSIVFSNVLGVANGGCAGPGLANSSQPTYGWSMSTQVDYVFNGLCKFRFNNAIYSGTSDGALGFQNNTNSAAGTVDVGISRTAAGSISVGNGTAQDETGLLRWNECRVTADITLTVNTDITVCTWSLPAVAKAWAFQCKIPWVISAGTGTNTLVIKVNPSQTPTGTTGAMAEIKTSNANVATEAYANFSTSGATTILTSPTITPAATVFQAEVSGTVLASATAGTFAVQMQAAGTTATAAAKAGATCILY